MSAVLFFALPALARGADPVTLLTASERGTFNIGPAQAGVVDTLDGAKKKKVLKLDVKAAPGSVVGVWTKGYPASVGAASAGAFKAGVKVLSGASGPAAVTLEVKGEAGVQSVPLKGAGDGWAVTTAPLDWKLIGGLKEVVFVVSPKAQDKPFSASLLFDFEFLKALPAAAKGKAPQGLLAAKEWGAFNVGPSEGAVKVVSDAARKRDVLLLEYVIPAGTAVGLWTKSWPAAVGPKTSNGVRVGARFSAPGVEAALEIKGAKDVQSIPLKSGGKGWTNTESSVDWAKIGTLKEVVFVLSPRQAKGTTRGALTVDLDFIKLKPAVSPKESAPVAPQEPETLVSPEEPPSVPQDPSWEMAAERGIFNIGLSEGSLGVAPDETLSRKVLSLDYKIPAGTALGIWTKGYAPDVFNAEAANAVRLSIKAAPGVSALVELKGEKDIQALPLELSPEGWSVVDRAVDWARIGALRELVLVLSPAGKDVSVQGNVRFDALFVQADVPPPAPVAGAESPSRVGGRIVLSLLWAFALTLFGALLKKLLPAWWAEKSAEKKSADESLSFGRDFRMGAALAGLLVLAVSVQALGTQAPASRGFDFVYLALLGAFVGAFFKSALISRLPTPLELFQNAAVTGLLAAVSSPQVLLQAPMGWSQLALKSNLTAAVTLLVYHGLNAYRLSNAKKHLGPAAAALIAGTPFLTGWLLTLQNPGLVRSFSGALVFNTLSAWPQVMEVLGRLLVVFSFNVLVAQGISLAAKGKALRAAKAHLLLFFTSLGVVLAPSLADAGSSAAASLPVWAHLPWVLLTTMLSQAGIWAEVYLITGLILDGTNSTAPTAPSIGHHVGVGAKKGLAYSGLFMLIVHGLVYFSSLSSLTSFLVGQPLLGGLLAGVFLFPLGKTIIESFDGSTPFFQRLGMAYQDGVLFLRGALVGAGVAWAARLGLIHQDTTHRILYGLGAGLAASVGVSFLRDLSNSLRDRGFIRPWRAYLVDAGVGGFIGAALAFYLDAAQVATVADKLKLYTAAGSPSQDYTVYPLLSKWGRIDLGAYTGGVKLFFNEVLSGVIGWAVAAWLFAINRTFMEAYFQKDKAPIKFLFSPQGFVELIKHMIYVLRWGLWMAPIINTFLRMMGEATWYNQDGAVRTLMAVWQNVALSPEGFQAWSLKVFVSLLAYDFVRVLIWIDHMGLRVATLVNLSFIGMNRLDDKVAKFIGRSATQRYLAEGVKRFTTWAPLLIPFYIPRGANWDHAWNTAEGIQNAAPKGVWAGKILALSFGQVVAFAVLAFLGFFLVSFAVRALRRRSERRRERVEEISNRSYRVSAKESGEVIGHVTTKGYDVSRRSYDRLDPSGRALFLVDTAQAEGHAARVWPVMGNYPRDRFKAALVSRTGSSLHLDTINHGVRALVDISLPDAEATAELWTVTIENQTDKPRRLKVAPYLEWVVDRPDVDRGHTQYNRLFPEMEFVAMQNTVLASQKHSKSMGFLACETAPEGFHSSRMDFIGRARSLWSPRLLDTMNFLPARDSAPAPTFDPIGSLLVDAAVAARATVTLRFLVGFAKTREASLEMVTRFLAPRSFGNLLPAQKRTPLIGHGEIPPGTPQPYFAFKSGGDVLHVKTPYTPRPFDHAMSNALAHSVMVTNRGLHTSSSGNSQQNRITPDWPDTVTRELPGEAIYLYDADTNEWFSPTHHPLNDVAAVNEAFFGVDGTALFEMSRGTISTKLTVFVPSKEPLGVYLLTVRNDGPRARKFRVAPYFQIVLAGQPEMAGPLDVSRDEGRSALFFENPRNTFRSGPAFASFSIPAEKMETRRGRFFGAGRGVDKPYFLQYAGPDTSPTSDDRPVAALLGTIEIPAGEERTVAVVMGQADTRRAAEALVDKYKDLQKATASLDDTRRWWMSLMNTVKVETTEPAFNQIQNWFKYQAVAERIWARRGFYQTSGAYGFRDQLQDSVNLLWVDPLLARKQILLHASQQFIEGDVVHWFHTLYDGRTAFSNRSHASDNLLWLPWAVGEYVRGTGDNTLLDEMTSYLMAETPFQPLPKNKHGWGTIYLRSPLGDTVYRHCLKAIDLVLEKRMGKNGLPLIGTGDWNDGLDEIGSEGRGESVWLGFFLHYLLNNLLDVVERKDGKGRRAHYEAKLKDLAQALEGTWREDRYLRAFHDDGTEIGVKGSGVWEIDALTAAWAVMAGTNFERGVTVFETALSVLEKDNVILLGWPALREDTKPYLGRSSHYPEGVRENGMYCHGVQWLIKAARLLAEEFARRGDEEKAARYRATSYRLWLKISPVSHVVPSEIEIYGGAPNKQAADLLTTFDPGRMIWNGYTGAAGWMLRQSLEGVIGASLVNNEVLMPSDIAAPRGTLTVSKVVRNIVVSPVASLNGTVRS